MFLGSSKYIKDKTFYCGKSKNILFFPFNQFKSCVDVESWHDDVGSDAGELVSCSKLSDHGSDPEKQKKRKSKIQINFHCISIHWRFSGKLLKRSVYPELMKCQCGMMRWFSLQVMGQVELSVAMIRYVNAQWIG